MRRTFLNIAPEPSGQGGSAGGGPAAGGGGQSPGGSRSQGFLALALGFAVGLTLVIFFLVFRVLGSSPSFLEEWVFPGPKESSYLLNMLQTFLFGFIGGAFISLVYNLLVVHRLNLFGFERNVD